MKSTFYVEAEYIGQEEEGPWHRRQTYILEIRQSLLHRIYIVPVHGYECKPMVSMAWTYNSLEEFFEEWKVEHTYHPPPIPGE